MTKEYEMRQFLAEKVFNHVLDSATASETLKSRVRRSKERLEKLDATGIVNYYWSAIVGTGKSTELAEQLRRLGLPRFEETIDEFRHRFGDKWGEIVNSLCNESLRNEEIRYRLINTLLYDAESEIDIMCPWIDRRVADNLGRGIEAALKRGVKVKILYGMTDSGRRSGSKQTETEDAVRYLRGRFRGYDPAFRAKNSADSVNPEGSHGKLLICDDIFYIQGSYNWLSFGGDYTGGAREEIAEVSRNLELLARYRSTYFDF